MKRRRLFAPEVIQASAMDCGPAALRCLLEGHRTPVSFGRLREACQTDVDGTSIDALEEVALRLGLEAEQVMLPIDHLLLEETEALPALVVLRLPGGLTHFVVAWRRQGPFVQVMDPAVGRCWQTPARFLGDCFIHEAELPAAVWRDWAGSDGFRNGLRERLGALRVPRELGEGLTGDAFEDPGWRRPAALDAATRMTAALAASGAVARGRECGEVLRRLYEGACTQPGFVPDEYWSARQAPPAADGTERLKIKGAVLLSVRGARLPDVAGSPELAAALEEKPARPGRELVRLLASDGALAPTVLGLSLLLAAGAVILEALLFRGFLDLGRELGLSGQRLGAVMSLLALLALLLLLEFPLASAALRMGRRLECRLRMEFLRKIPRLGDRYFQSRLKSDMTERSHTMHRIRRLPDLGAQLSRAVFELLLTAGGIAWLDPGSAPLAAMAAAMALALPLAVQPMLQGRDLRMRTHTGALSRYYLDALLGLSAIRCHGAERAIRYEHEGRLAEWTRAGFGLQRLAVGVEGVQFLAGLGLSIWLLFNHLSRHHEAGVALLLVYWALNLPVLSQEIAQIAWQYPALRTSTLRLLEPLGAIEREAPSANASAAAGTIAATRPPASAGMNIRFSDVGVRAAGHTILEDVNLDLAAGSHVAIVGHSGAGKSSLVGLLLGWHRAAAGAVLIDGQPIDAVGLDALRRQVAWVDPAVQIWNRSFVDNLCYGSPDAARARVGEVIDSADLIRVLETLPGGWRTPLGEGGSMLSGGEGQRVRLGRALLRTEARLAILDEPFRGLERQQRDDLLARARRLWSDATLICITHDVRSTRGFDRVVVLEHGRIVEDGRPDELAERKSRYHDLLEAEETVMDALWADPSWRRLYLASGKLIEAPTTASLDSAGVAP